MFLNLKSLWDLLTISHSLIQLERVVTLCSLQFVGSNLVFSSRYSLFSVLIPNQYFPVRIHRSSKCSAHVIDKKQHIAIVGFRHVFCLSNLPNMYHFHFWVLHRHLQVTYCSTVFDLTYITNRMFPSKGAALFLHSHCSYPGSKNWFYQSSPPCSLPV